MAIRVRFLLLLALSALLQILLVCGDGKPPSTDVFVFKEAGINFATTGRFTAKNLPHMQPEEEFIFSYYPPAYPFTFGLWSKAFGIGLAQSGYFDLWWRIARTALIFLLVAQLTPLLSSAPKFWQIATTTFLFLLSFLSTDADRPDEMGLFFALAAWWVFARCPMGPKTLERCVCGLLAGLAASASPACGVFAGLGLLFLTFSQGLSFRALRQVAGMALIAGLVFFGGTLPIILADPWAYYRFSRQVPMSTFPYLEPLWAGKGWRGCAESLVFYLHPWVAVASPYLVATGAAVAASTLAYYSINRKRRSHLAWIYYAGLSFVPVVVAVWTRQPYYLWFPTIALLTFVVTAINEETLHRKRMLTLGLAVAGMVPLGLRETKHALNALQTPREETPSAIREKVLAHVGPSERIAITPDQYFTFWGKRQIANLTYMCDRLDAFDYVYVSRLLSAKRDRLGPVPIPCESPLPRCFVPIADFSSKKVLMLLGMETNYFVKGAGGTLYQNRRCTYSLKRVAARVPIYPLQ